MWSGWRPDPKLGCRDKVFETIDHACAHPLALPVFVSIYTGGVVIFGVSVIGEALAFLTAVLLLLARDAERRSSKALHAKLDDVIIHVPEAKTELARLEDLPEREIDALREADGPDQENSRDLP